MAAVNETPLHAEGREFTDEDWYGDHLGAARFVDCTFTRVDFGEATTSGATFEGCTFHNCSFGSSVHISSAFVGCDIRRS